MDLTKLNFVDIKYNGNEAIGFTTSNLTAYLAVFIPKNTDPDDINFIINVDGVSVDQNKSNDYFINKTKLIESSSDQVVYLPFNFFDFKQTITTNIIVNLSLTNNSVLEDTIQIIYRYEKSLSNYNTPFNFTINNYIDKFVLQWIETIEQSEYILGYNIYYRSENELFENKKLFNESIINISSKDKFNTIIYDDYEEKILSENEIDSSDMIQYSKITAKEPIKKYETTLNKTITIEGQPQDEFLNNVIYYFSISYVYTYNDKIFETIINNEIPSYLVNINNELQSFRIPTFDELLNGMISSYTANHLIDFKDASEIRDLYYPLAVEHYKQIIKNDLYMKAKNIHELMSIDDENNDGIQDLVDESEYKLNLRTYLGMTDTEIYNLFSSFYDSLGIAKGITRKSSSPSSGIVVFSSPTILDNVAEIKINTVLSGINKDGETIFLQTTKEFSINSNNKNRFYNSAKRRFEIAVPVKTIISGSSSELLAYTVDTIVGGAPTYFTVENPSLITGGRDQESDFDYSKRIIYKETSGDTGTKYGYASTILSMTKATDASVVRAGDQLMLRDYNSSLQQHLYGKVDIYIDGEESALLTENKSIAFKTIGSPYLKTGESPYYVYIASNSVGPDIIKYVQMKFLTNNCNEFNKIIKVLLIYDQTKNAILYENKFKDTPSINLISNLEAYYNYDGFELNFNINNDSNNIEDIDIFTICYTTYSIDDVNLINKPILDIAYITSNINLLPYDAENISTEIQYYISSSDNLLFSNSSTKENKKLSFYIPESSTDVNGFVQIPSTLNTLSTYLEKNNLTLTIQNGISTFPDSNILLESVKIYDTLGQVYNIDEDYILTQSEDGLTTILDVRITGSDIINATSIITYYQYKEAATVYINNDQLIYKAQNIVNDWGHVAADCLIKRKNKIGISLYSKIEKQTDFNLTDILGEASENINSLFLKNKKVLYISDFAEELLNTNGINRLIPNKATGAFIDKLCYENNSLILMEPHSSTANKIYKFPISSSIGDSFNAQSLDFLEQLRQLSITQFNNFFEDIKNKGEDTSVGTNWYNAKSYLGLLSGQIPFNNISTYEDIINNQYIKALMDTYPEESNFYFNENDDIKLYMYIKINENIKNTILVTENVLNHETISSGGFINNPKGVVFNNVYINGVNNLKQIIYSTFVTGAFITNTKRVIFNSPLVNVNNLPGISYYITYYSFDENVENIVYDIYKDDISKLYLSKIELYE